MSTLSFSISPNAAAWIGEQLRQPEQVPYSGLVPVLCFSFNYQHKDEQGRVFERWPHPSFGIGWFPPEAVHGCVEIEVLGLKFLVPPDVVERLEGKQLVLETVEVGYPTPADKTRQLLTAVPRNL